MFPIIYRRVPVAYAQNNSLAENAVSGEPVYGTRFPFYRARTWCGDTSIDHRTKVGKDLGRSGMEPTRARNSIFASDGDSGLSD
jgi:hypothetical protein